MAQVNTKAKKEKEEKPSVEKLLTITCAECGEEHEIVSAENGTIEISPCPNCAEPEYGDYDEGFDEGHDAGLRDGIKIGEKRERDRWEKKKRSSRIKAQKK